MSVTNSAYLPSNLDEFGFPKVNTFNSPNSINITGGNSNSSDKPTGLAGILNGLGVMDDKGQLFGVSKDGWNGAGAAFGIGKGVFDIMSANKNYGLAKRYYEHQMGLQNEQAKMARDEYNRINTARDKLNSSYMEKS